MKKASVKIDWVVAENEEAWQTSQSATPIEVAPSPRRRQRLALAIVATTLLLLIGGWLWHQPVPAKAPPTNLSSIFVREEQTLTDTIGLLDTSVQVDSILRLGDRVMARVIAFYPEDGKMRADRESHFYEKSASEWQRIPPDPALLGPQKSLQITHFTILYRAVDADAVYEAAPRLEQLYATLRRDLGLSVSASSSLTTSLFATSGFTIEVATDQVQPPANYSYSQRTIRVSSSILFSAPVAMPPAVLLYQEVVYPLTYAILSDAVDQHDMRWILNFGQSSTFTDAFTLWELWEDGVPLADERDGLMRWLYENGKKPSTVKRLPESYAHLCRTHRIWQTTPIDFAIPLTCSDADKSLAPTVLYTTLSPIWNSWNSQKGKRNSNGGVTFTSVLSAVTVLEYIVATHGRAKVPQLVEAMGDYTTLEGSIPALFGVSVTDFEAGWQSYLAQRYDPER